MNSSVVDGCRCMHKNTRGFGGHLIFEQNRHQFIYIIKGIFLKEKNILFLSEARWS